VPQPPITDHEVLIKVRVVGVNPIDYFTVPDMPGVKPLLHFPGVEVCDNNVIIFLTKVIINIIFIKDKMMETYVGDER
jgi:hypothetical protein